MVVALHAQDSQRLGRYGRFTERTKTKLKCMAVPAINLGCDDDDELRNVLACGGSGEDSWWLSSNKHLPFLYSTLEHFLLFFFFFF